MSATQRLRNLAPGDGDRDSVGVLQQRPSQGWGGGDPNALTDVGEATKEFLDALIDVPESVTSVEPGETVTVLPLDEEF